jgi:hypothetical protein
VPHRRDARQSAVFRNSLATGGEEDWDCALCGFANKPRALGCNLCGSDHDALVLNYTAVREREREKKGSFALKARVLRRWVGGRIGAFCAS